MATQKAKPDTAPTAADAEQPGDQPALPEASDDPATDVEMPHPPPTDDQPTGRHDAPNPLVMARFVDVQTVYSPSQGLIGYGDLFEVTAEQLADDPRLIAWSDDWTPDPAALAAATLEG